MRKFVSTVIASALVSSCFTAVFAATATDEELPMPIENMPVVYYGTPIIDGIKDDCYSDESKIYTGKTIKVNCIADDGSRGYAWMAWDYKGLSVFFEVNESTPAAKGKDQYMDDSCEIFLDEDLSRTRTGIEDSNDAQYRVTIVGKNSQGMSAPTKFESAAVRNDGKGKYYIELKAPWLDIVPAKDTIVGFDIQINDGDMSGRRIFCTGWWSDEENNWQYTDKYGAVNLQLGDYYPKWDRVSPLKVSVNGVEIDTSEAPPIIENDRTLVPMRAIFERLNAGVAWNQEEGAAYVIGNKKLIVMTVGSSEIMVNGKPVQSDVPVKIVNERTMVPLRLISELLGAEVVFDDIQGAVFVKK